MESEILEYKLELLNMFEFIDFNQLKSIKFDNNKNRKLWQH